MHERFPEMLKAETATPPLASIRVSQAGFDRFQAECNDERPHEAFGKRTPSLLYASSRRHAPIALHGHEYPETIEVRRVRRDGTIKRDGGYVFIGGAATQGLMGPECVDEARWRIRLGPMRRVVLHERARTVVTNREPDNQGAVTHALRYASTCHARR